MKKIVPTLNLMKIKLIILACISALTCFATTTDPILKLEFNTVCTACTNSTKLFPLKVFGHSGMTVNGGIKRGVTLTFKCQEFVKCGKCKNCKQGKMCRRPKRCKTFTMPAEVFVENEKRATQVGYDWQLGQGVFQ